jgi:3-hydroxyisobutyrate dehydrogenase-like beta-hydroxyacid dehydrogenase
MKKTIAIVSPGDMGHGVGARLRERGLRVLYCPAGRSKRTCSLAEEAGLEAVPSYNDLVSQADIVLSIVVPAAAKSAAEEIARALQATSINLLYADCNAIAPQTAREVQHIITSAGSPFVDASIIGGPPRGDYTPRIYVAGDVNKELAFLNEYGLNMIHFSDRIGDASALKMCFASMTKGSTALYLTLMTGARALGVYDTLMEEFSQSQPSRIQSLQRLPGVMTKARRFVGEMEEMDRTYSSVGIDPNMLKGAAEIYRLLGNTSLADRVPEDTSPLPSLEETLDTILSFMGKKNTGIIE